MKNLLFFFCFLLFSSEIFSQVEITIPENFSSYEIPLSIKGINQTANANIQYINNASFIAEYPKLKVGSFRYPGGTMSNNYNWKAELNNTSKFNFKQAVSFADTLGVAINYSINYGTITPHEAAEFVRMCNSTEIKYKNLRNTYLGVSDPIDIEIWEIGNELAAKWEWHVSWVAGGFGQKIFYQTGISKDMPRTLTDSLHYWGGSLWRSGWVPEAGDGMNKINSILGATHFINPSDGDSVIVDIEFAPIFQDSILVWVVDTAISKNLDSLTQQQIYDLIAQSKYSLDTNFYHTMGDTAVMVYNNPPLDTNMFILVEYKTKHSGAFEIRDSMKAADPTIEIGYCIDFRTNLLGNPAFDMRLVQSPPDFLIKHPYNSNTELPLSYNLFTEILYMAEKLMTNTYPKKQRELDSIVAAMALPNPIGYGFTEWNIRLCGDGGCNPAYNGILGGLYTANFFIQSYEAERNAEVDIRVNNHFATVGEGNNLIHLFHYFEPSNSITTTPQSHAIRMVNEVVDKNYIFLDSVSINGNPIIQVLDETKTPGVFDTVLVSAIKIVAGIDSIENTFNILLLNTDDANSYNIIINTPTAWNSDSCFIETMNGHPLSSAFSLSLDTLLIPGNQFTFLLDTFSMTTIKIPYSQTSGTKRKPKEDEFNVFPNPTKSFTVISSGNNAPYSLKLYSIAGQLIKQVSYIQEENYSLSTDLLEQGIYILRLSNENSLNKVIKLIIQ